MDERTQERFDSQSLAHSLTHSQSLTITQFAPSWAHSLTHSLSVSQSVSQSVRAIIIVRSLTHCQSLPAPTPHCVTRSSAAVSQSVPSSLRRCVTLFCSCCLLFSPCLLFALHFALLRCIIIRCRVDGRRPPPPSPLPFPFSLFPAIVHVLWLLVWCGVVWFDLVDGGDVENRGRGRSRTKTEAHPCVLFGTCLCGRRRAPRFWHAASPFLCYAGIICCPRSASFLCGCVVIVC